MLTCERLSNWLAVDLGVDLVVHVRRHGGEAVGSILADDVGFDGAGARVGEVNDRTGQRVVLLVQHFAGQELASRSLLRAGTYDSHDQQHGYGESPFHDRSPNRYSSHSTLDAVRCPAARRP
jgi:hypothetical protein